MKILMHLHKNPSRFGAALLLLSVQLNAQDLAETAKTYQPKLEKNLKENIAAFWYPKTIDRKNGGYILNHDNQGNFKGEGTKMIVTQSRMVWLFARLARAGYDGKEYLDAADVGYQFLKEKMWDAR